MVDVPRIEITFDPEKIRQLRRDLNEMSDQIPTVLQRAVNAGVRAGRKAMITAASIRLGIDPVDIQERVWGNRAKMKADPVGKIRGGRIGWPLRQFAPVQEPEGVSVLLGDRTRMYRHAFILGEKWGGAVVQRYPKGTRGPRGGKIFTPRTEDITSAVLAMGRESEVADAALASAMRSLDRAVERLLNEKAKGAA